MDAKLIFYIVIGVVYLIYSIYKSVRKADEERLERQRRMAEQAQMEAEARKQGAKSPQASKRTVQSIPMAPEPVPTPKPTSLEDLLREFGMETQEVTEAPAPIFQIPKSAPLEDSRKPLVIDYEDEVEDELVTARKKKEEIEREIAEVKKRGVDEKGDFHLDPYKLKERQSNEYREWMKDKANIKKAFVASEIFKTKF